MNLSNTITIYELAWTLICSPGLYYAGKLLRSATIDLVILRRNRINSIREYAAITTMIMFFMSALVQFMFVLIGVVLMTTKNGSSQSPQILIFSMFVTVSLSKNFLLYIVNTRRRKLIEKIKEVEDFEE